LAGLVSIYQDHHQGVDDAQNLDAIENSSCEIANVYPTWL